MLCCGFSIGILCQQIIANIAGLCVTDSVTYIARVLHRLEDLLAGVWCMSLTAWCTLHG